MKIEIDKDLIIYKVKVDDDKIYIQDFGKVNAGFPSPAEDFVQNRLSLDERFLTHPETSYIVEVGGHSMEREYSINDILLIRSDLRPNHLDDVIVSVNKDKFTLKRFDIKANKLIALNSKYNESVQLHEGDEVIILGVVTVQMRERRKS